MRLSEVFCAFEPVSLREFFATKVLTNFPAAAPAGQKIATTKTIHASLADGVTRTFSVETEYDPERPFVVPETVAGRFCEVPGIGEMLEMKKQPVAVDSRRYRFSRIDKDGYFELHKDW
jgi:hypothetical protein